MLSRMSRPTPAATCRCLAECAGAKATSQQPDSNGNCPKAAGSAGGSTKAPEQPQKQQDKQQAQQEPQPPKNLGFMCRCAQSNTPVCGTGASTLAA